MVAGLLLTGGRSRRLGTEKARLVFAGETLAQRAARVLDGVCDRVVELGPGYTSWPHIVEEPPGGGPLAAPKTTDASATPSGCQRPSTTIAIAMNPRPADMFSAKVPACASTKHPPASPPASPRRRSILAVTWS